MRFDGLCSGGTKQGLAIAVMEAEPVAWQWSVVIDGIGVSQVVEKLVEVALGVEGAFRLEHGDNVFAAQAHDGAVRILLEKVEVFFSEVKRR